MKMKPWIITGVSLLCAGAICCGCSPVPCRLHWIRNAT